jgi:hypothetical protein
VTEIDERIAGGEGVLNHPVNGDVLIPLAVLLRRRRRGIDDLRLHHDAGPHEVLLLGRRQKLRVLSNIHLALLRSFVQSA